MRIMLKRCGSILFLVFTYGSALACEVCKKQQPKVTQGFTHGAGPQSNWDWVIIGVITAITVLTLVYSMKYLIKPKEENAGHIKNSILIPD